MIDTIRHFADFLLGFTLTLLFFGFMGALTLGAVFAVKDGGCTYDTPAKKYSGGYWVGCELFKTRWHHD